MHVGILGGTGPAGRALGARLAAAGSKVTLGSRDLQRAEAAAAEISEAWRELQLPIVGGTNEQAAAAEMVVLATVAEAAVETAVSLAAPLEGKVLVSMANGMTRVDKEFQALFPARGSIAATVQAALPRVGVSAAFHHLPAGEFADVARPISSDVLVCADAERAAEQTVQLVDSIPGLRALRAGSLAAATAIEALTAVLVNVNVRYRAHTTLRLTGLPDDSRGDPR